jgi:hypothetical protein
VLVTAAMPLPASANTPVICNPITNKCTVVVVSPGDLSGSRTGQRNVGRTRGRADAPSHGISLRDMCTTTIAVPQPPPSDPIWSGHPPGSGQVYVHVCPLTKWGPVTGLLWQPASARPATVTPAQLARQALASLRLPPPTFERSPRADNSDHGVPYTWVNLWTWYWTSPQSWRVLTRRAAVGPVWAQVAVAPTALVFDPGDGSGAVSCAGPGRAWRPDDDDRAPTSGGCGYRYRRVSASGTVTATVAITWTVTWQGSGGTGGTLPAMTTRTSSAFAVEQIQAVTR